MNVKKGWTLEFWKGNRIERYHTFEATPEEALKTQAIYRRTGDTVLLVLNQPQPEASNCASNLTTLKTLDK
jgi:hypothetical protein